MKELTENEKKRVDMELFLGVQKADDAFLDGMHKGQWAFAQILYGTIFVKDKKWELHRQNMPHPDPFRTNEQSEERLLKWMCKAINTLTLTGAV